MRAGIAALRRPEPIPAPMNPAAPYCGRLDGVVIAEASALGLPLAAVQDGR
jgi:hypothetical protein